MATDQARESIALAQRKRLAGAQVRRELKGGKITLAQALAHPDVGALQVERLLRDQRQWGRQRAASAIRIAGIARQLRVDELSDDQRASLLAGRS